MNVLLWSANVLGWPVIHLAIGRVMLLRPAGDFANDSWLTREYHWEGAGRVYRTAIGIHRWKRHLPDGAPWLGGKAKKCIATRRAGHLQSFLRETRRAEVAHWWMLLCTPVFFLWNPPWACAVMTAYGVAANVPCILAQRSNRIQLKRMILRVTRFESLTRARKTAC